MLNFNWFNNINLIVAKLIILAVFLLQFVFALLFTKEYIYAGAQDKSKWRNLKYWIFLLTLIMITIYVIF
jgi:hypothetical protein